MISVDSLPHQQYPYPQLPVTTVPLHLLSRPVLLALCVCYLQQGQWKEGIELIESLFVNLNKGDSASSDSLSRLDRCERFHMLVPLLADGGRTVLSDQHVDSELVRVAVRIET